jgi:hypothetical protein
MKKAHDIIKDFWGNINDNLIDSSGRYLYRYDIALVIKQAQIEAIEETVKACAEAAKAFNYGENGEGLDLTEFINKQSILSVADQLKAKL